ncbi:MAG: hypothetical protein ACYC0V_08750 [Armatimonadota bacterium]
MSEHISKTKNSIQTIGLYPFRDIPGQHEFLKSCGFNMFQFWENGYMHRPDLLDDYYAKIHQDIEGAKKDGFTVFILISANMKQWTGPAEKGSAVGLRFYPRDKDGMNERLEYIAKAVKLLNNADGFTFTAGDPGGVPKELGPSGVQDWISMAREVKQVVNCVAPNALFDINPWAVTQWEDEGMDVFDYLFWQKEVSNAKEIVAADNLISDECGIEFCPHNYYRSLALTLYDKASIAPELYPTRKEVEVLKQHNVPRLWAWPYFLIDEVDDGYLGPDGFSSGQTQGETRYIHKMVKDLRGIGLNGLIANGSPESCKAEALNTYAFAQLCLNPSLTPTDVIMQYAALIATPSTAEDLSQVLRFIENHSTWQNGLPEKYRLPNFECSIKSAKDGLSALENIIPAKESSFPLPEPPTDYLKRLKIRLELISKHEG